MGQKFIFNQLPSASPIFRVTEGAPTPIVFHQLGLEGSPPALWELHLWACVSVANVGATPTLSMGVTDRDTGTSYNVALHTFESVASDPGAAARVVKVADGLPLRGNLDLFAFAANTAGGSESIPCWGYMKRGTVRDSGERRVLSAAEIGGAAFAGGQAVLLDGAPGSVAPIHETIDDGFIDEITMDYTGSPGGAGGATILRFSADPTQFMRMIRPLSGPQNTQRVFDGIPTRGAGTLEAEIVDPDALVTGWVERY